MQAHAAAHGTAHRRACLDLSLCLLSEHHFQAVARGARSPCQRGTADAILAATATMPTASAADNPFHRGPDPTPASVAATTGPFATASVSVPRGNGFGGGRIYYPTATNQGTFGAIAISPGLNGTWPGIAWLGPRLASQGFVVFGIETNNLNDSPTSRGTQLLAALDYLTQRSTVRGRVDASRLAVAGLWKGGNVTSRSLDRRNVALLPLPGTRSPATRLPEPATHVPGRATRRGGLGESDVLPR